jgi:hypothetical protein
MPGLVSFGVLENGWLLSVQNPLPNISMTMGFAAHLETLRTLRSVILFHGNR